MLGTLWLPFGHSVPTTATLTQAAPRVAGQLVAGVRERFPGSASAGSPEGTAASTFVVAPPPTTAGGVAGPAAGPAGGTAGAAGLAETGDGAESPGPVAGLTPGG